MDKVIGPCGSRADSADDPKAPPTLKPYYILMLIASSMNLALRLYSAIRYTVYSSKRPFSTMSASTIVLPYQEIDHLWFGGLNLQPGEPPPMDAVKRWFRKDTIFDTTCK